MRKIKDMSMRASLVAILVAGGMALGAGGALAADASKAVSANWDLLNQYCGDCHNSVDWAGEVAFDTMSAKDVPQHAEIWEEAIRKLRGGLMPPPGKPRPDQKELEGFAVSLENYLDKTAQSRPPQPGHVSLHRLNRKEYANSVRDLLGVDIDPAHYLPPDTASDGFDNIANVLKISPTFLDQYLAAARDISIRAVGDPHPDAARAVYTADGTNPYLHIDGLPLGTRGGLLVRHEFPADGDYVFNIEGVLGARYVYGVYHPHTIILTVDDKKVFETTVGGPEDFKEVDQQQEAAENRIKERFQNIKVHVPAGVHRIGATFIERSMAESDDVLQPLDPIVQDQEGNTGSHDRVSRIKGLEILGPYDPTGLSETASRDAIFICRPETEAAEWGCAEKIFSNIARRAYRRPVNDDDMATLRRFYDSGRKTGTFDDGIQKGIMAILATPKFLYRGMPPSTGMAPGQLFEISDLELAARLSFFLWSSVPDNELIDTAIAGNLRDPKVMERELKRMLADPRAKSLVTDFAFQWLQITDLDHLEDRDPAHFPNFDDALVDSFRREMEYFISSIFSEDKDVVDLMTADYTFVNERLADFYGLAGVNGDRFRKVHLNDSHRWGLLGKGAILTVSSYPNRTSPVLRGQWILEKIIDAPPSAPPAGVNTNLDADPNAAKATTVRERLEIHRAEPSCNMCHGVIDPLGLALENFNAIGEWRDTDRWTGTTIDAAGKLATGGALGGPDDLRKALVSDPSRFAATFTQKLLAYAIGRTVEAEDMPTVRHIVANAAKSDYRLSAIVQGIVESPTFQMERVPAMAENGKDPVKEAALAQ
jgi:hypothetical protein